MNASKENCTEARVKLDHMRRVMGEAAYPHAEAFDFIESFLDVAHRKLPREASFPRKSKPKSKV